MPDPRSLRAQLDRLRKEIAAARPPALVAVRPRIAVKGAPSHVAWIPAARENGPRLYIPGGEEEEPAP